MRVTHTTSQITITDGPGAVKLLDAFIWRHDPKTNGHHVPPGYPPRLRFTGTDGTGTEQSVSLTLDDDLHRLNHWVDHPMHGMFLRNSSEFIGYRFAARIDGEAVEVEYWLKDTPEHGRGFIRDAVKETA